MPFSTSSEKHTQLYWTNFYDNFLKKLIEEIPDIEVERSTIRREDVLTEIIKNVITADIVVADLTDFNPNVFWELGIRQSFKHGTITIAEDGTELPFDISKKGTHYYYPNDTLKNEFFRKKFKEALLDCISNPQRPDSVVLEAIGGRGSLFELIRFDEVRRRIIALRSETETNKSVLEECFEIAKNNVERRQLKKDAEKNKDKIKQLGQEQIPTRRLRIAAIELLIANRYLDETDKFYSKAESYYGGLITVNDQLRIWESVPIPTEQWLIKTDESYLKRMNDFSTLLAKILDGVVKK